MKVQVAHYRVEGLEWWDYFDLVYAFTTIKYTKMKKTQEGTCVWEDTGKLRGLLLHLQVACWCVDLRLDIRDDIEEEAQ